ncbi:MAG TPA: class III extradiol ring-cleavage dioxygenase [Allocoleopsis sp.]
MNRLPTLFLSHGAPDLPLQQGTAQTFLSQLHQKIPQPQSILVISAHWNTPYPLVSAAPSPRTIHDFSGFPEPLYHLTYPAPGAPDLAERVVQQLTHAGLQAATHPNRGLDHGAWTPLLLAYPDANIPVTQLSIQALLGPDYHWRLGRALEPLRDEGVLMVASGAATHNLGAFDPIYDAVPPTWVTLFDRWLADTITQGDIPQLLQYRQVAPYAQENHPTEEHLLPLFVALGAGGESPQGIQLHSSYVYGVFSMAAYAFV